VKSRPQEEGPEEDEDKVGDGDAVRCSQTTHIKFQHRLRRPGHCGADQVIVVLNAHPAWHDQEVVTTTTVLLKSAAHEHRCENHCGAVLMSKGCVLAERTTSVQILKVRVNLYVFPGPSSKYKRSDSRQTRQQCDSMRCNVGDQHLRVPSISVGVILPFEVQFCS
jgi:hypothetical protein